MDAQTCVQVDGVFTFCLANQASPRRRVWAPDGGPSDRLPLSGSPTGWAAFCIIKPGVVVQLGLYPCPIRCLQHPEVVKRLHFSEIDVSLSDSPTVQPLYCAGGTIEHSDHHLSTID